MRICESWSIKDVRYRCSMAFELEFWHVWRVNPSMHCSSCLAAGLQGWRAYHSHECRDYDQGWACLSLAVLARWRGELGVVWPTKWIWCGMKGRKLHVSHLLPPLTGQHGSRLPYISHTSRSQRADVLPATLHGCLALHLPTTVHRPTALLWSIV